MAKNSLQKRSVQPSTLRKSNTKLENSKAILLCFKQNLLLWRSKYQSKGYLVKPSGKKYSDITYLMAKQVCKHSVTWTKIVCVGLCDSQWRSQQSLRVQLNF